MARTYYQQTTQADGYEVWFMIGIVVILCFSFVLLTNGPHNFVDALMSVQR